MREREEHAPRTHRWEKEVKKKKKKIVFFFRNEYDMKVVTCLK